MQDGNIVNNITQDSVQLCAYFIHFNFASVREKHSFVLQM